MIIFKNEKIKEEKILLETEITLQSGEKVKRQVEDAFLDCDRELKYFLLNKQVKNLLVSIFDTEKIDKVLDTVVLSDIVGHESATLTSDNKFDFNKEYGWVIDYIFTDSPKYVKQDGVVKAIEQYRYSFLKPFECNYSDVLIKPLLNMEFKNNVANELDIYCGTSNDAISIYLKSNKVFYTLNNGEKQYMSITLNIKDLMYKVDDIIDKIVKYNIENLYKTDYNMNVSEIEKTIKKEIVNFYNRLHANILTK